MKRILFFITSLAGGGAEKVLVNLANYLPCNKYDITVQTLFDVGVNKQNLNPKVKYKSVFKRPIRGISKYLLLFSPEKLYKTFVNDEYDIVVSFFQGPTTRIVAGCQDHKTKLVQWIHNEFHERRQITKSYRSDKECVRLQFRYDANIFVAETVRKAYLDIFPELKSRNNHILYNIIESDKIRKMANETVADKERLYSGQFNLISVGRMVRQKSFDRLLNITGRLLQEGLSINLLLLGSGDLEEKLKMQANNLGISEHVFFLGYQSNPYKYVKRADLFVCSSLHEGFSTAVSEALIVGTPVVTTMCSGMEELLGENSEYGLITDNNEDSLYEGIMKMLRDTELLHYYREKSIERGNRFNTQGAMAAVEDFFDEL